MKIGENELMVRFLIVPVSADRNRLGGMSEDCPRALFAGVFRVKQSVFHAEQSVFRVEQTFIRRNALSLVACTIGPFIK